MENLVCEKLKEYNIKYNVQKTFNWLMWKNKMRLDIFLPEYNIAIECQGGQHFYPVNFYGGHEEYVDIVNRDKRKKELCNMHSINVLYYTNIKLEEYPYDVITNLDELIQKIKG